MRRKRGQLVVLAAAALAIALVPMALAYLQLGYHADVQTAPTEETLPAVDRTLERTLVTASDGIPERYDWNDRTTAVTTLRDRLDPSLTSVRRSKLDSGTAIQITYNNSRARGWANTHCPRGPDRQFGPCRTDRGVVVQERAGETHVLAIAVDVTVTRPDGESHATSVVTGPTGAV